MKEKLKQTLDLQSRTNKSISRELYDYIRRHFMNVNRDDYAGRKWHKVHCSDHDSKYGAFMVCLESEQWRNVTMEEFYGGAVVD